MKIKNSYVKLSEVIDKDKFRYWNRGTWTRGKPILSTARTKTVYGGNFRIIYSDKMSYGKVIKCDIKPSKPILSTVVNCKSGKFDENSWMKSGKKY